MAKGPTVSTTFNAVDKMTRPMRKMQGAVLRFAAAAGAAFVTGKAAQAVQNFANAGDEIAKSARKIGVSVEALQELRFAADRSGISSEGLTTSLEKLNKNVGDLRAGTGSLRTILDKTNPALAEQLKNAENNEQAFNLLVNEIANTENAMDKAALAQAAFGRAGQDILIMAENGTQGIAQLREEARKYGNIISTDAAAASEKFVDSMTNIKSAGQGLLNNALLPIIEKLQPLIQRMADFVAKNRELINLKIDKAFEDIIEKVKSFLNFLSKIKPIIYSVTAALVLYKAAVIATAAAHVVLASIMSIAKFIKFIKTVMAIKKAYGLWTAAQWALNTAMNANLIGIIIVAIAALIGIVILLVKNWDWVKEKFWQFVNFMKEGIQKIWNWFSGLLDNPFFVGIGLLFAPWLTIPALIIKHWQPIMDFFKKIVDTIGGAISAVGDFFGGNEYQGRSARGGERGLVGRNDGTMSRTETNNNSTLDVNFNNAPEGTSFNRRGRAPNINLNTGYGGGRL